MLSSSPFRWFKLSVNIIGYKGVISTAINQFEWVYRVERKEEGKVWGKLK